MNTTVNQGQQDQSDEPNDLPQMGELTVLKARAKMMGVIHSNNITVETLREKIRAKQEGDDQAEEANKQLGEAAQAANPASATLAAVAAANPLNPLTDSSPGASLDKPQKKLTLRQMLMNREMKLIRCRITNMDPKKKDLQGEIFTVANEYLGTVRKFVPFGEATDEGWHVPFIIYKMMDERKFLNIRTTKDKRTGQIRVENHWAKEFALEVLEPLTSEELRRLAAAQSAAGTTA
jgi:hypothetical protein